MSRVATEMNLDEKGLTPSLFGLKYSNRDFSKLESWSKNKFNSSFPASLIAYMGSKGLPMVYLKLDEHGNLKRDYISATELFGIDPCSDETHYGFECEYQDFRPFTDDAAPKVDLLISRIGAARKQEALRGFEMKLTTLPDETTCTFDESEYGCEMVIRWPTIHFLACSIASIYAEDHTRLRTYFGKNGFGNPGSYMEAAQVNPVLGDIWTRITALVRDNVSNQKPSIIQPIWKTNGKSATLSENCLDVFVWSDLAFTKLFIPEKQMVSPKDPTSGISRPMRAMIQLFFMLNDVSKRGRMDSKDIFNKLNYETKNDKAFSISGRKSQPMMACKELQQPRVQKKEIRNIILGGGHRLLSPERRFDAALVNSPDLFD
jgi:HindVP restriction endonuclease